MKNFFKKYWKYLVFIPIIAVLLIGIIYNITKDDDTLELEVYDIKVEVNEWIEIVYKINIEDAVCTFKTSDDSIAIVEDNYIVGVSEGETELIVTATYGNSLIRSKSSVIVFTETGESEIVVEEGTISIKRSIIDENELTEISLSIGTSVILYITANDEITYDVPEGLSLIASKTIVMAYKLEASAAGEYEIKFYCKDVCKVLKVTVDE